MGFAEQMKGFTDELRRSTRARETALADVNASTDKLLSDARAFMQRVAQEHKGRAEQLRTSLAGSHRQLQEQGQALRQEHARRLSEMRAQLQHLFDQNRQERHNKVNGLLRAFAGARTELARDLQEAGHIWRNHTS